MRGWKFLLVTVGFLTIAGSVHAQDAGTPVTTIDPTATNGGTAVDNGGNSVIQIGHKYITPVTVSYRDFRQQLSKAGGSNPVRAQDLQSSGPMPIDPSLTVTHIIGATVRDDTGKTVGQIQDITLDAQGNAKQLIIVDSGYFGNSGKPVAINYPTLQDAAPGSDSVRVIPKSSLSANGTYDKNQDSQTLHVADLLGAAMKSPTDQSIGQIGNVVMNNGQATYLVVSFNAIAGLGGDKAVMNFSDADIVNKNNSGTFVQLTSHQADTLTGLRANK